MADANLYATVTRTTDVRNDAAGNHDMGNLSPGATIHVVETYDKNGVLWYRADNLDHFTQPGYNETWVLASDTTLEDIGPEPPLPGTPIISDEAAGTAFVALVNWIVAKFKR